MGARVGGMRGQEKKREVRGARARREGRGEEVRRGRSLIGTQKWSYLDP